MRFIRHDAILRKPEPPPAVTDHSNRRLQPDFQPVGEPLFDARFRRLIDHLCSLGSRPVGEFLLQLVGTGDDDRTALIVLLEQYQRLDADVVAALGGDRWPGTIFPVEPT